MEYGIAIEVWIALAGAASISGWLIGDWNGSERMRKLIGSNQDTDFHDWEPLHVAEKRVSTPSPISRQAHAKKKAHGLIGGVGSENQLAKMAEKTPQELESKLSTASDVSQSGYDERANCDHVNSSTAAGDRYDQPSQEDMMPSLHDLHAQAEAIRRDDCVWSHIELGIDLGNLAPSSAKVLDQFKTSIEFLKNVDAISEMETGLGSVSCDGANEHAPFFDGLARETDSDSDSLGFSKSDKHKSLSRVE